MSFSLEVKEELAGVSPECSHCTRATLAAIVRIEGTLRFEGKGRFSLEVSSDVSPVARFVSKALLDEYGLKTNITIRRSVLHKNFNYLVEVPYQPGMSEALADLGVLAKDGGLQDGIAPHLVSKLCCGAAYVRGAFMGSGFISEPKSDAHFEITVEDEQTALDLAELFARKGIPARAKLRRNSYIVYLKSGGDIVGFLSYSGAHVAALKLENARVLKSVRSDVNRQINAELANQKKAAVAAVDQVFAARKVVNYYGAGKIPPALKELIRLRVQYPNASLKELGEHANPPLSKSAVSHRVRRLMQMAENIPDKGNG